MKKKETKINQENFSREIKAKYQNKKTEGIVQILIMK